MKVSGAFRGIAEVDLWGWRAWSLSSRSVRRPREDDHRRSMRHGYGVSECRDTKKREIEKEVDLEREIHFFVHDGIENSVGL